MGGGRPLLVQGLIDSTGAVVVAPRYEAIGPYRQGRAPAAALTPQGRRWGYLNAAGQWAVAAQYEAAGPYVLGRARVRLGGATAYIDSAGRPLSAARFTLGEDFGAAGLGAHARVQRDSLWGLIDAAGAEVLPCSFDAIVPLGQGLLRVLRRGKLGYYDLGTASYRYTEPYFFE